MAPMFFRRKLVFIGDAGSGKTSLLYAAAKGQFVDVDQLMVQENFETIVDTKESVESSSADIRVKFSMFDTDQFERFRALTYPDTDVVLLCFSTHQSNSLVNVKEKWVPEVKRLCPHAALFLVGTKTDLRGPDRLVIVSKKLDVSAEEGRMAAEAVHATAYLECSAKTGQGVRLVMEAAARAAAARPERKKSRRNKCLLL